MSNDIAAPAVSSGYMLRFPFRPLHWVTDLESETSFSFEGLQCSLQAEEPHLVVRVQPFSSEQDAVGFLPRLWGALAWISVELRTGFVAEMEADSVTFAKDPLRAAEYREKAFGIPNRGPVHGMVLGDRPSVIPVGKNIRAIKMGKATGTVTWSAQKYVPSFSKALSQPRVDSLYNNEKVRTAIELLSDSQRENSIRSKFLTCMTALEILAEPVMKHEVVQRLLDDLNTKITEQIARYAANTDEYHALESLQRELVFRREASIRSNIRNLVLDGLGDVSEDVRFSRSKDVVWAYDVRGSLIHDSRVSLADLHQAHDIGYQILLDLLARIIGLVHS